LCDDDGKQKQAPDYPLGRSISGTSNSSGGHTSAPLPIGPSVEIQRPAVCVCNGIQDNSPAAIRGGPASTRSHARRAHCTAKGPSCHTWDQPVCLAELCTPWHAAARAWTEHDAEIAGSDHRTVFRDTRPASSLPVPPNDAAAESIATALLSAEPDFDRPSEHLAWVSFQSYVESVASVSSFGDNETVAVQSPSCSSLLSDDGSVTAPASLDRVVTAKNDVSKPTLRVGEAGIRAGTALVADAPSIFARNAIVANRQQLGAQLRRSARASGAIPPAGAYSGATGTVTGTVAAGNGSFSVTGGSKDSLLSASQQPIISRPVCV